jgi:hypothetical protein
MVVYQAQLEPKTPPSHSGMWKTTNKNIGLVTNLTYKNMVTVVYQAQLERNTTPSAHGAAWFFGARIKRQFTRRNWNQKHHPHTVMAYKNTVMVVYQAQLEPKTPPSHSGMWKTTNKNIGLVTNSPRLGPT